MWINCGYLDSSEVATLVRTLYSLSINKSTSESTVNSMTCVFVFFWSEIKNLECSLRRHLRKIG